MQVNKKPSAMIADDCEDIRDLLRYWLEANHYSVVEAVNGQEAVELAGGECPDLILMDLLMPVLDGWEATRLIRERFGEREVRIVAMSSHPTAEARANAFAAGCSSFIAEPVDFDQLSGLLGCPPPASAGSQSYAAA